MSGRPSRDDGGSTRDENCLSRSWRGADARAIDGCAPPCRAEITYGTWYGVETYTVTLYNVSDQLISQTTDTVATTLTIEFYGLPTSLTLQASLYMTDADILVRQAWYLMALMACRGPFSTRCTQQGMRLRILTQSLGTMPTQRTPANTSTGAASYTPT